MTDRYTNAEVADNLSFTRRDLLVLSERLARLQKLVEGEAYPTGINMLSRTIADLNSAAERIDERMEILAAREGR